MEKMGLRRCHGNGPLLPTASSRGESPEQLVRGKQSWPESQQNGPRATSSSCGVGGPHKRESGQAEARLTGAAPSS